MRKHSIAVVAVIAVVIVTALAGAHPAVADGAVSISACQTLTDTNTTYKLTTDLTSCGSCLIVAGNRITIDLQGHSITSTCPGGGPASGAAIYDGSRPWDLIAVKNGSVSGYFVGVRLDGSTRVSVLGVTATNIADIGIAVGVQGLVKACETSGGNAGVRLAGDRGQVQQCNVHGSTTGILAERDNCLITMNTANSNGAFGIVTLGDRCTVSYNTASNNGVAGIDAGATVDGSGHLVTHNVALNNIYDFGIRCPSVVTYNDSTAGFPASYFIQGSGCHFVNNE